MTTKMNTTRKTTIPKKSSRRSARTAAAVMLAVTAAAGFMASLPDPANADDGCVWQTTSIGFQCVVDISAGDDPLDQYGAEHGTLPGHGDDGTGDDEDEGGGEIEPDQGNPPTTTTPPATTTTTTISPADRARRQKALLLQRLRQQPCFDTLFPDNSGVTRAQRLAAIILQFAPGINVKALSNAANGGVNDPAAAVLNFFTIETAGSPTQTSTTLSPGPAGTTVTLPQSFWSASAVPPLDAESTRTAALMNLFNFGSSSDEDFLFHCFGYIEPGIGD